MSFKKGFFKNLLVFGGFNYAAQILSFGSTVITSRFLLPESFGFVGLITVFTGFISVFADSGITLAVIKSDYLGTYHKAVGSLSLWIGITLCLLTWLLAIPLSLFYKNSELVIPTLVLGSLFVIRSLSLLRGALLSKSMRFNIIGRTTLISTSVQVLLTIILAYLGADYWSLIIPQVVSSFLILLLYEKETNVGFKVYPLPYVKVAFAHTKRTIGNIMGFNSVNYWARNSDNLIVGKFYGVADLGIYNRGYNLLMIPLTLITGIIGAVLYPSLKKSKSEGGDFHKEYFFILRMITVISYPISFVLILFPNELVMVLWGKNWIEVAKLLPYFGLLIFSQTLISTTGNILVLIGKENIMRISGWISAFVMIGGISFGAIFSITAIAQYYSLAFIIFTLPFNLIYIFIKTIGFNKKEMLLFFLPVIFISLSIWLACFFDIPLLRMGGLMFLAIFIIVNVRGELKYLIKKIPQLSFNYKSK